MAHEIALRHISALTHDTYLLRFDKPDGYRFSAGQATDMALPFDGLEDETRPFTFTSQPADETLEFVIKCYPEHGGVTERIPDLAPGMRVRIGDPWGAISDKGPGTFIAGGAGITPFIPILRSHAAKGALGSRLIYANKSVDDIILREEWNRTTGLQAVYVTDDSDDGYPDGPIAESLLNRAIPHFDGTFYLCGPPAMGEAVTEMLLRMGATQDRIVTEDKPSEDARQELFRAA